MKDILLKNVLFVCICSGFTITSPAQTSYEAEAGTDAKDTGFITSPKSTSDFVYGPDYNLITSPVQMYWPSQPLTKPGYLETLIDPDFGTKITRITGDPGSPIPKIGSTWKTVARHGYSKRPVWNADESLIYLETHKGGLSPLFLDGETYEVLFYGQPSSRERRWHPTNPDLMIILNGNEVKSWNVRNDNITVLANFPGYNDCYFGPWEGNLSSDGKWVAIYANRISDTTKVGFAADLENGIKYPDIDLSGVDVDWISISASGKYLVLQGTISGGDDQTQVYDLQGNKIGSLWSQYGRPSHYDLTVDENGDDVAVGVSKSSPDNGRVIKRRLIDGAVTVLTTGGYATHTSTRCPGRPGWAVSSFNHRGPTNWTPYYNEIAVIKLDGTRVERVCHMRNLFKIYDNEAQPCPSPSGSRIIFAGDWENNDYPVQAYVVDFREGMVPVGIESIADHNQPGNNPGTSHIYPNPASEYIFIPDQYINFNYRILSMNGQVIERGRSDTNMKDISNFKPGFYIIEFFNLTEIKRYTYIVISD